MRGVDFYRYMMRMDFAFENNSDFPPSEEAESGFWFYGSMLRILHSAHSLECNEVHYCSERFAELIRLGKLR